MSNITPAAKHGGDSRMIWGLNATVGVTWFVLQENAPVNESKTTTKYKYVNVNM